MTESMPHEIRDRTDKLDALGNTTAATGKGFAIGSAVLTSLSLLAAFKANVGGGMNFDVSDSIVLSGILFGAMLPWHANESAGAATRAHADLVDRMSDQTLLAVGCCRTRHWLCLGLFRVCLGFPFTCLGFV